MSRRRSTILYKEWYGLHSSSHASSIEYSVKRDCSVAPSMVHDAMRSMEEKGTVPDESWMEALKEAAATSFLGTHFIC